MDVIVSLATSDLMSVAEAAQELGRPRITLYRWIQLGKIGSTKIGGTIFVHRVDVARIKKKGHR